MFSKLLLAAALAVTPTNFTQLTTEFKVNVNDVPVEGAADKFVPIPLPAGSRFTCERAPVQREEDTFQVLVGCKEGNKPVFVVGALCLTDRPDADVAELVINVAGPDQKPVLVPIMVGCRTVPKQEIL